MKSKNKKNNNKTVAGKTPYFEIVRNFAPNRTLYVLIIRMHLINRSYNCNISKLIHENDIFAVVLYTLTRLNSVFQLDILLSVLTYSILTKGNYILHLQSHQGRATIISDGLTIAA